MQKTKLFHPAQISFKIQRRWLIGALAVLILITIAIIVLMGSTGQASDLTPLPEADKIYAVQGNIPFQIMAPAFLPQHFSRSNVDVQVNQSGPGGEPMAELTYRNSEGAAIFIRQWVPVNPDLEILANSRPIQTKWGKGWLYRQGDVLRALWVDVGPTRISVFSDNLDVVTEDQLLAVAETLGPPSNNQVFYFDAAPKVKDMAPPPAFEVKTNDQGIQELTLVVTPGGYSPIRFAVKKGVPVRLHFRMLGPVGCGNVLIFPSSPTGSSSLTLKSANDEAVLDFTPQQEGSFEFFCAHQMYRGIMIVNP